MANISRPFGLRPQRYLNGSAWNGQTQIYAFAAAQANDAYKGDVVGIDATNRSTALGDNYMIGIPLVLPKVAGLTTTAYRGVIAGFLPQPEFSQSATATLGLQYRQASTARYVWVIDDVNVIFEAEENGSTYTTALNNGINKTWDLNYVAGNTVTGISKSQITGPQTAAVRPFRALRLTQRPDNFNFAAGDTSPFIHYDITIANSDLAQANVGA